MSPDDEGSHELQIVKLPEDAGVEVVLRKRQRHVAQHLRASALVMLAMLVVGVILPLPSLLAFLMKSVVYAMPFGDAPAASASITSFFGHRAVNYSMRLAFAYLLARLAAPTPVVHESVLALRGLGVQLTTKKLGLPGLAQLPSMLLNAEYRAALAEDVLHATQATLLRGGGEAAKAQRPAPRNRAMLGAVHTDFVDAASVRTVVVNEGIQSCRVFYYLALVVRGRRQLMHCFPAACPRVAVLTPAYRALHATLCPEAAAATSHADEVLGEAALAAEDAAAPQ